MARTKKRHRELDEILPFITFTNIFRKGKREIWTKNERGRERTIAHTCQLALFCWAVNKRYNLGLDDAAVLKRALAHDIPETYGKDTPAFAPRGKKNVLHHDTKRDREKKSRDRIEKEQGAFFPELIQNIDAYMAQDDEVSRFVSAMDKLLAILNVYLDGGRSWRILKVTIETMDLYKRPRIAAHAFVLEVYEALFARMSAEKKKLFAKSREPA